MATEQSSNGVSQEGRSAGRLPIWRRLHWKRIVFLVLGLFLFGRYFLSGLGLTETDRVLLVIDKAEEAVEGKKVLKFQSLLSRDYHDRSGLDRRLIVALATRHFHTQDSLQIIQLRKVVEFPEEGRAVVDLRVQIVGRTGGMWSRGLTDDSPLGEKFTIHLQKEEEEWKITAVDPEKRKWPRM